jgi:hypothetical protein
MGFLAVTGELLMKSIEIHIPGVIIFVTLGMRGGRTLETNTCKSAP